MSNKTMTNIIGIVSGLLAFANREKLLNAVKNIKAGGSQASPSEPKKNLFDKNFSSYEQELILAIHTKFFDKVNNSQVPLALIYATLWQESGGFIVQGKPNNVIIGDEGISTGYFQINKFGALLDVNQKEGTNYTSQDLLDEDVNIFVGLKYLSYCYSSALSQTKNKEVAWLSAKKYNGGIDETENSSNKMATNYANSVLDKYKKLEIFFQLNT